MHGHSPALAPRVDSEIVQMLGVADIHGVVFCYRPSVHALSGKRSCSLTNVFRGLSRWGRGLEFVPSVRRRPSLACSAKLRWSIVTVRPAASRCALVV